MPTLRCRLAPSWPPRVLRAVLLGCALVAASCSTPASPTIATISEQGLAGVWRLEVLQSAGQPPLPPPAGSAYTLTFADGFVSPSGACTSCDAGFTLVGDSLNVAQIFSCGPTFCPIDSFTAQFRTILAGESAVGVEGPRMSLVSGRGQLIFIR